MVPVHGKRSEATRRARALAAALRESAPAGVLDVVPGLASVVVHYDPLTTSHECVHAAVDAATRLTVQPVTAPRRILLPACYGEDLGPDLEAVAEATGLAPGDVVARHSGVDYEVWMVGFLPGFAYLGPLDAALRLPRRSTPRVRVPAGSLAVAADLTAVYPAPSPGGWHLVGAVPVTLFDAAAEPPVLLAPGDTVRFVPIERAEFDELVALGRSSPP